MGNNPYIQKKENDEKNDILERLEIYIVWCLWLVGYRWFCHRYFLTYLSLYDKQKYVFLFNNNDVNSSYLLMAYVPDIDYIRYFTYSS